MIWREDKCLSNFSTKDVERTNLIFLIEKELAFPQVPYWDRRQFFFSNLIFFLYVVDIIFWQKWTDCIVSVIKIISPKRICWVDVSVNSLTNDGKKKCVTVSLLEFLFSELSIKATEMLFALYTFESSSVIFTRLTLLSVVMQGERECQ